MIKSRKMRWAGHATTTGRRGMHIGLLWGSQKKIGLQEDVDVVFMIILK
jgi:hypothetical protein